MKTATTESTRSSRRVLWIASGTTFGMAVPLSVWLVGDPNQFFGETLGVNHEVMQMPRAWLLAVGVTFAYIAYTAWAVPFVRRNILSLAPIKLVALPLALASGTLEELVFRKYLMDWLAAHGMAPLVQVSVSALAFGLAHAVWAVFARDASIVLPVAAATTALGMMLASVYLASDRIALPAIVAHVAINLAIEPWLLISATNGRWRDGRPSDVP